MLAVHRLTLQVTDEATACKMASKKPQQQNQKSYRAMANEKLFSAKSQQPELLPLGVECLLKYLTPKQNTVREVTCSSIAASALQSLLPIFGWTQLGISRVHVVLY